MIGIAGYEIVVLGTLAAVVLLLAYRMSRRTSGSIADVIFVAAVAVGALVAAPVMTVILLAMIYQQLALIARKG